MQYDLPEQYFMVVNEQSTGPYTYDEIINHAAFAPETLVWKAGLANWVPASTLPEFAAIISANNPESSQRPPEYNIPNQGFDSNNQGGYNPGNQGYNPNGSGYNPNGQGYAHKGQGYQQQGPANNNFANNPQYRQDHTYNQNQNHNYYHPHHHYDPYNQGYRPPMRTNWLPWAIVATVLGFFCSCIGAIFGIIAIVQSNKANGLYARGFDADGDAANSNAKTMTIIGLVFAGIGIFIAFFFGGIFNSIGNYYY